MLRFLQAIFAPICGFVKQFCKTKRKKTRIIGYRPSTTTLRYVKPRGRHPKMSYRQYRNYRDLVETTVDDCILYDRMQEVARLGKRYPDNAFIQMIFWELVLVAPEEHLRKLVDNYEKTRDKPGPIGWTRKDYEKFVEQVFKPVEKAVYEDGMTYEEALEKHECSKSYYRTRRNEARKMGLIRKKGNQWVYWE